MVDAADVFAELNRAFAVDPTIIAVPAGKAVAEPVIVTHGISGRGTRDSPDSSSTPGRTAR